MGVLGQLIKIYKFQFKRAFRDWRTLKKDDLAQKILTGKTHCRYLLCQYQSPIPSKLFQNNRNRNLKVACSKLDNVLIKPNQLFSLFHLLGLPEPKTGYSMGPHWDEDKVIQNYESGLGQIASVLFYLTLLADFKIVEHHPARIAPQAFDHDYVPLGCEACITWAFRDLRFQSHFPFDVALHMQMNESEIVGSLYGHENREISALIESEILEEKPFPTKKFALERFPKHSGKIVRHGCKGYRVRIHRKVIKNKEVLESKVLFEREYEPLPKLAVAKK
jgi:vancomycin resistance protein VanW